jgi:hypothetical protein
MRYARSDIDLMRRALARAFPDASRHLPVAGCCFRAPISWAGSERSEDMWSADGGVAPSAVIRLIYSDRLHGVTGADKLRHTKYITMREDIDPKKAVRET